MTVGVHSREMIPYRPGTTGTVHSSAPTSPSKEKKDYMAVKSDLEFGLKESLAKVVTKGTGTPPANTLPRTTSSHPVILSPLGRVIKNRSLIPPLENPLTDTLEVGLPLIPMTVTLLPTGATVGGTPLDKRT